MALHIATDRPAVAYDIWPYGGGNSAVTSATLLLPTSAWDKNYIAVDAYPPVSTSWVALIGSQDNTMVSLTPTADIPAGPGVTAASTGITQTYSLNRGEVLAFLIYGGLELVGTPVQSSAPIALFGGADCMFVGGYACDSGHQQIPPVRALGHEYVVARHRDRYKGQVEWGPVRVVGAVDGTALTYDPVTPPDAPQTLGKGQMVEFRSPSPFVVRSQDEKHPFYVAAYMTGATAYAPDGVQGAEKDGRGDPEFVNVIPPQEYLPQYTFFTDPTYPETELVVVRQKSGRGSFADVTLDCLGTVSGWQPVDSAGTYQVGACDKRPT
jgi:hypothetical protein